MPVVCGIDCGTLRSPSWVAWLDDSQFYLDSYVPTESAPLPALTFLPGDVRCMAIDAPQGLPASGATVREADRDANTPTRRLPQDREALARWTAYRGLIEAGISVFWWVFEQRLAAIPGLSEEMGATMSVVETYPRYMLRRLWPDLVIPSKRRDPIAYVDALYPRIQKRGYVCRSVIRPSVDQVDAMLCALAAERVVRAGGLPSGTVGAPPVADTDARVLREGYIV